MTSSFCPPFRFAAAATAWLAAAALGAGEPASPKTFGSDAFSVYAASAFEFAPRGSDEVYETDADGYRYTISGSRSLAATAHLPEGAEITIIRLHNCDPGGGHLSLFLYDFFGDRQNTPIASLVSTARTGCGDDAELVSPFYMNTSNVGHHLLLVVFQNGPTDGSVSFDRAEVFYRRTVRPAPATATFGDVPTSHPFFQFIEALEASGITAGCGSGNFCPDQPLTRGQMAVFLANALGLHWPNTLF